MIRYPLYLWPELTEHLWGSPAVVRSDAELAKVLPGLLDLSPAGRVAVTLDGAKPTANSHVFTELDTPDGP